MTIQRIDVSVYQLDFLGLLEDGEHQNLPDVQNLDGLFAMKPASFLIAKLARDAPAPVPRRFRERFRGKDAYPTDTRLLYGHSRYR